LLTNRATRLEVSQGHQTWLFDFENVETLISRSEVTRGHWKWYIR